jgi:NADP-dependent 3-hydroxy acid dehydrogenase YdfG
MTRPDATQKDLMTTRPHDSAASTPVVTGANKGLGREAARRLLAAGTVP